MKTELKIESGVPIPPPRHLNGMTAVMRRMKIGDSFSCEKPAGTFHSTAALAGIKISMRRLDDGTYRVWRIA
jgi:hypothetical protein